MSEVWLARDLELDREVAVKLHAAHGDPARFVREARAAASLGHENIAAVFDFGEEDGTQYLVLEHLSGGSLEERLPPGKPLPEDDVRAIAGQLAAGLAHAHAHGIVHRDLKPSNVLFDNEGRAKLADFGIAHARGEATLTEAGTILGTAAYLSPEQAAGEQTGPPADVYSFGVILYRMLTGRLPFQGEQPLELALKHREETPAPIEELAPDAPADLAALATAALAKAAKDRPPDGGALVAALEGDATVVLPPATAPDPTEATVALPRTPAPGPSAQERRRRRLFPLLATLAVLAGGGLALALLVASGGDETSPTTAPNVPKHTSSAQPTTTAAPEPTTAPSTHTTTTEPTTTTAPTTQPPTTSPPTTTVGTTVPATVSTG